MTEMPKIFPLGDGAVTVDFGDLISLEVNQKAISLAAYFSQNTFPGFIESVPAYASVSIFFDVLSVRKNFPDFPTAFDAVRSFVHDALDRASTLASSIQPRRVEIPVSFDDDDALDIDFLMKNSGLARTELIDVFTSATYRVYMLGFLPGFAYMGEVDERIAAPRRDSPRLKVPKGSVGIAGKQTGIYPLESPGGWQIIGRSKVEMFSPHAAEPCLLRAGDEVRFVHAN